ncbi:hypothetical protein [Solimonas sp. SE-A11]|uniref:hypothetical protein n=1 Tax=Solimonas sp. SE-A11 TaxID=3054954 RepID=UPI00259CD0A1|nr:hypothetical protein [Solimonas sp. SE-A11]MDM4772913.1 hypothetical protein [Solimonas sp. SE-A11]
MNSVRSVALLLAQLHAGDRRWLLSQLDPAQQQRIGSELQAVLRLPRATRRREAARVSSPTALAERKAAPSEEVHELQPLIDRIDRADESRMMALWQGSAPWLLQAFLAVHPWRYSAALRSLLPTSRMAASAGGQRPLLVRRRLLESVLAVLEREAPLEALR